MIENMFRSIAAWDYTQVAPKPYGLFHIIFTVIGLTLSVFFALKFRRASDKTNRIILLSVGIFLALTEVYKQLFYYFAMGDTPYYHWWIFPFQLCSVPMYLSIISGIIKESVVRRAMFNFMYTFNLLGGLMAFIEPSGVLHQHWTLTLHACVWHMLLVFLGLYLGLSERTGKTKKDYFLSVLVFLALSCFAFIINLALWNVSSGSVNMFYVGPATSPLAVFKTIASNFGWYVNTPIYLIAVSLGAFIVSLPFKFIKFKKQ